VVAAATSSARSEQIASEARALLEEEGHEALTMRRLGERLGIRAPSLYKHFRDKDELEAAVVAAGTHELRDAWASPQPAPAHRAYALEHPHLYRLMSERGLPLPEHDVSTFAFVHGVVLLELSGVISSTRAEAMLVEPPPTAAGPRARRSPVVRAWRGPD
jgi:AcrR family transcriptional regulator